MRKLCLYTCVYKHVKQLILLDDYDDMHIKQQVKESHTRGNL